MDVNVNPGDLITAKLFNQMVDQLSDVDARLTVLESAIQADEGVTIQPLGKSVCIGEEMTIVGTNFEVPVRLNHVMLNGIQIISFNPGSDDSHLVFNVPTILSVPRDVSFIVNNHNGSASINVTVLPSDQKIPKGEMRVTPGPIDQGAIELGETYTFPFVLDSQTNIAETYMLVVLYSAASGTSVSSWSANTRIANAVGSTIYTVTVSPGSPITLNVIVTVPEGAESVDMKLQVLSVNSSDDPLLNVVSPTIDITVGEASELPDMRTTFGAPIVVPKERLVLDEQLGQVIETAVGEQMLVRITAEFTFTGTYGYTAVINPASEAIWAATVESPAPPRTSETTDSAQDIVVQLSAVSADSEPSRKLEIHAKRTGPGGETFDSWFSIAIRNPG